MLYYYCARRKRAKTLSGKTCPRCGTIMEKVSTSTSIPGMYKWACPKCGYVVHSDT